MAEAHGNAGAAARDVVKLQGTVTVNVGGVHDGAGKHATAVDVKKEVAGSASALPEQKVTASSSTASEEQEYDSGDDVYKGNAASFTAKEVEKIKAKGVASLYNRKIKKWHCPYCTTKPKPKDGRFDHLMSHVEDVAIHGEDYLIRGQHAALAKALTLA
ncbi:hypothetical protein VPH35_104803 [Triticum aestivum]